MSRSLSLLDNAFKQKVQIVLGKVNSEATDYELRVFYTLRTPQEQARLWRQSRSIEQVREAVRMLKRSGANYLADVMVAVGPQNGRWATNALPGHSWHQWGLAVDCFVAAGGRAVWSANHIGYRRYAEIARDQGLEAGGFWPRKDAVHVQMNSERVSYRYDWAEVDRQMKARFS